MPQDANKKLLQEVSELRLRLEEAQETLRAIQHGEVDALVVSTPTGEQVFTIAGAEKPYRVLIEEMKEGAVMLSEDNAILYCNGSFAKMMKSNLDKIMGSSICNLIPIAYKAIFKELMNQCKKDTETISKEFKLQATDTTLFPALISFNTFKGGSTKTTFLIVTDLTEQKKTEEKLQVSNRKLSEILDSMQESFYVLDRDWNFVYANKQITAAVGMQPKDWVGTNLWKLFPKYIGTNIEENYRAVMEKREIRRFESSSEYSGVWYLVTAYPSVEGISVLATNITERKRLEKELKDKERLAAIGATAAMVGHDIRNPLQTVTNELYLAREEMKMMPDSEFKANMKESLDEIAEQTLYVNKIVADLQDYAKPLAPKLEEVDLEGIFQAVLSSVDIDQIEFSESVSIMYFIEKCFPKIKVDRTYLQRILQNLINNAIQAMPNGGKLTLTAHHMNGKAIIMVEDSGEGIPLEVRGQLFTPLVSTKSKGQGFGLAVVKRFTEGLGGTVRFESEIGKGTKFIIELPV
jgi:PAS domain S-box-containing protein